MTSDPYSDIQPSDTTDAGTAVDNMLAKRRRELELSRRRDREAYVRQLMRAIEAVFVGEKQGDVDALLDDLQVCLAASPDLHEVLAPSFDGLPDKQKVLYRRFARKREQSRENDAVGDWPRRKEYRVYVRVAIALGNIHAASDKTRMAPVQLEKLTIRGARSPVDGEPTPIGRVRISGASPVELEERATTIEHQDCEHVLVIANPREGKDALICSLAGNLKDEHGYKWVSLHDDGRNETPMIAAPNDEAAIQQSVQNFGQTPKGYPTKVYVPALGLPDELPRNHVPFTVGVDSLSPEIITQLSGVNPEGETQERIKYAVDESGGRVDELIRLLEKYATDTSAEVTVTETAARETVDAGEEETYSETRTYEMGEDKVLEDCAKSLMLLASEGLLADSGTDTNLDMTDVLADQAHVAVLNSNFLPEGDEHIKYLLENVWLRLILKERDRNPWLPRVAIEVREIKELAPSTLSRAKYSHIAKSLRQTLFHLSSQGGSRRIMLLGSTQYLRDVFLPVRGNMPIKVLLKMGEEKISILENAGFNFSFEQTQQIKDFDPGWGMLLEPDGKTYPINWRGPRCALGLGDLEWIDRYGLAMGFRVQHTEVPTLESWTHDASIYYDRDGTKRESPPNRQEWYLLPRDIDTVGIDADEDADSIEEEVVLKVVEKRREWPVPQDLRPAPLDDAGRQRELQLVSTAEAEERQENEIYQEFGIDGVLRDWTSRRERTVTKMTRILEAIRDHNVETYEQLSDLTGIGESSIKAYSNESTQLEKCLEKQDGTYTLTPVGVNALDISWGAVFDEL